MPVTLSGQNQQNDNDRGTRIVPTESPRTKRVLRGAHGYVNDSTTLLLFNNVFGFSLLDHRPFGQSENFFQLFPQPGTIGHITRDIITTTISYNTHTYVIVLLRVLVQCLRRLNRRGISARTTTIMYINTATGNYTTIIYTHMYTKKYNSFYPYGREPWWAYDVTVACARLRLQ